MGRAVGIRVQFVILAPYFLRNMYARNHEYSSEHYHLIFKKTHIFLILILLQIVPIIFLNIIIT